MTKKDYAGLAVQDHKNHKKLLEIEVLLGTK